MILSRKRRFILSNKKNNVFFLKNALILLKNYSIFNFNESVDLSLKLSKDFDKFIKQIKGILYFPYNYFKFIKIFVFVDGYLEHLVRNIGYLNVGIFTLKKKFLLEDFNFDFFVTTNKFYNYIFLFSNILYSKNIKPVIIENDLNIEDFLLNWKIFGHNFKSDKYSIINLSFGKVNFNLNFLEKNFIYFLNYLRLIKNSLLKEKRMISKISISTTMGCSFYILNNYLF